MPFAPAGRTFREWVLIDDRNQARWAELTATQPWTALRVTSQPGAEFRPARRIKVADVDLVSRKPQPA